MSYTIVVDENERRRRTENRINIAVRHCKIGKVSVKHPKPKGWGGIPGFSIQPPYRDTTGCPPMAPWMMSGHWCNASSFARS